MWQRYAVSAIFSPIFTAVKERLKTLLNDKIIYSDGYPIQQLAARLHNNVGRFTFFENDLSK